MSMRHIHSCIQKLSTLSTRQNLNYIFFYKYQVLKPLKHNQCKVLLSVVSNIPTGYQTHGIWQELWEFCLSMKRGVWIPPPPSFLLFPLHPDILWLLMIFFLACCVVWPLTGGHNLFCADKWKHQKTHYWFHRQQTELDAVLWELMIIFFSRKRKPIKIKNNDNKETNESSKK